VRIDVVAHADMVGPPTRLAGVCMGAASNGAEDTRQSWLTPHLLPLRVNQDQSQGWVGRLPHPDAGKAASTLQAPVPGDPLLWVKVSASPARKAGVRRATPEPKAKKSRCRRGPSLVERVGEAPTLVATQGGKPS